MRGRASQVVLSIGGATRSVGKAGDIVKVEFMNFSIAPEATQREILPDEILGVLQCPRCSGKVVPEGSGLTCQACRSRFPAVNGLVRFVASQEYAGNFGFQWQKYGRTQLDNEISHSSEETFRRKTGFTPEQLRGKLVLDVGCGMGRFADVVSRWGARVIGIDLSEAVEVAAQNLGNRKSVTTFQADIFALPFAPMSFDFIYSIGVLHHTPSCEQAFKQLPPLLKPGGRIAIWIYSGYHKWYRCSDFYRRVTHRLPSPFLHSLCRVANPLYHVERHLSSVPVFGPPASAILKYLLPTSGDLRPEWRVLDTFDWYSPKYQSKHTYEEVFPWFESCGLEDLRVLQEPVSVQGRRPLN